jgi:hypothetical protein
MTDTAKLRELLAKATPGPWKTIQAAKPNGAEQSIDCGIFAGRDDLLAETFEIVGYLDGKGSPYKKLPSEVNAALIVAAVNALPALLDEIDKLRAAVDAAKNMADLENRYSPPAAIDSGWLRLNEALAAFEKAGERL